METTFRKLNEGWAADPNAPFPETSSDGSSRWLRFRPNTFIFPALAERPHEVLRFTNCSRYRFTSINDEAWYRGDCRFSRIAPEWGEFYEVRGDFMEAARAEPWITHERVSDTARNFLFYFRDETFECQAEDWGIVSESAVRMYQEPLHNV